MKNIMKFLIRVMALKYIENPYRRREHINAMTTRTNGGNRLQEKHPKSHSREDRKAERGKSLPDEDLPSDDTNVKIHPTITLLTPDHIWRASRRRTSKERHKKDLTIKTRTTYQLKTPQKPMFPNQS